MPPLTSAPGGRLRRPTRLRVLALATSLVAGLSASVVTAPSAGAVHPPTLNPLSAIEVYAP